MHIILSGSIQIWHFYRTLSRGLLISWTQCIYQCSRSAARIYWYRPLRRTSRRWKRNKFCP